MLRTTMECSEDMTAPLDLGDTLSTMNIRRFQVRETSLPPVLSRSLRRVTTSYVWTRMP
jgi:hypothetical protein